MTNTTEKALICYSLDDKKYILSTDPFSLTGDIEDAKNFKWVPKFARDRLLKGMSKYYKRNLVWKNSIRVTWNIDIAGGM